MKNVKFRAKLPPDVHDWLRTAAAERGMTADWLLIRAVRYYMDQPENALDMDQRICCGTDPQGGHRGTCQYSAVRGGPDSAEYRALKVMWQVAKHGQV